MFHMATLISRLKCGARDRDLWGVAAVLWLVSLVRVALGLAHHEVFGVEATAAFACVVAIPWLFIIPKDEPLRLTAISRRPTLRERLLQARRTQEGQ